MNKVIKILILVFLISSVYGQNFTSYITGDTSDFSVMPSSGICLMGGAGENDSAMAWFLKRANGGDILVLRTSGSDGYNNYMYSGLGVNVNSVETIVFHNSSASYEPYIHQRIQQAEAIWFAGGDQWNYISYWRNSPIESLINLAIANRKIVIGGISAGMAILGRFYFTAQNGTITSATALSNPYHNNITVDSSSFLSIPYLNNIITDTHYDNPNRKGRHIVFLARILLDYGTKAKGIACDEFTAVCIDTNGIAKVYGDYPDYDDNAYFIQINCELANVIPETCSVNQPLEWNLGNKAIKVYSVKGTKNASYVFDLNDWKTGIGGAWENWYVDNGILYEQSSLEPNCNITSNSNTQNETNNPIQLYPNPAGDYINIMFDEKLINPQSVRIINQQGQVIKEINIINSNKIQISLNNIPVGLYFVEIKSIDDNRQIKMIRY
jgi:cyanophycinase-like exopeptidase